MLTKTQITTTILSFLFCDTLDARAFPGARRQHYVERADSRFWRVFLAGGRTLREDHRRRLRRGGSRRSEKQRNRRSRSCPDSTCPRAARGKLPAAR